MNGADSYFWGDDPLPVSERKPRMVVFIGIDPGVSGGIAFVDEHGIMGGAFKMPDTGRDLLNLLQAIVYEQPDATRVRGVLEKVNPGVFGHNKAAGKMGVVSAFTFGRNVERCHMALIAAGIPFDEVLPVKWQTAMGCRTRGDKNISKARAQQLFPTVKVTHAIADALLIAEFCRRTERGRINTEPAPKGLFDGEEIKEREELHVTFTKNERLNPETGRYETVTTRRRARAPRRADPEAPAPGTVARRRGRSRLEEDRRRGV